MSATLMSATLMRSIPDHSGSADCFKGDQNGTMEIPWYQEFHSCKAEITQQIVLEHLFFLRGSKWLMKSFTKCLIIRQSESVSNFLLFFCIL